LVFAKYFIHFFKKGLSPNREAAPLKLYLLLSAGSVFNVRIGDALPYNGVVKWYRRERLENI
jgi:hypothetical protein